jgi:hypothetical protein
MKVNTKLHGFNFRLKATTTGGFLESHAPLVFGADLSHEMDKPSIVAMVCSMHAPCVLYEELVAVQALKEPQPGAPGAFSSLSVLPSSCSS